MPQARMSGMSQHHHHHTDSIGSDTRHNRNGQCPSPIGAGIECHFEGIDDDETHLMSSTKTNGVHHRTTNGYSNRACTSGGSATGSGMSTPRTTYDDDGSDYFACHSKSTTATTSKNGHRQSNGKSSSMVKLGREMRERKRSSSFDPAALNALQKFRQQKEDQVNKERRASSINVGQTHNEHHHHRDWSIIHGFEKVWRRLRHHHDADQHPQRHRATSAIVCLLEKDSHSNNMSKSAHALATTGGDKQLIDFNDHTETPRIVTDPEEFEDYAREEHLRFQHFLRSPVDCDERVLHHNVYMIEPWFHYGLSREDATKTIMNAGGGDGAYLVRTSRTLCGRFVISVAHNGSIQHFPISTRLVDGKPVLSIDNFDTKFRDLAQLVDFYQINTGPLPCKLLHYVTKAVNVPRYQNPTNLVRSV